MWLDHTGKNTKRKCVEDFLNKLVHVGPIRTTQISIFKLVFDALLQIYITCPLFNKLPLIPPMV